MTLPPEPATPDVSQDLNGLGDEDLIAALASGCPDAITVLFDRYSRVVFPSPERILRNPQEAEEVRQIVFLTVFRMAGKFDRERGWVKIWLRQYAYSQSLRRKHQWNARHFYTTEEIDSVMSELAKCDSRAPSELSPEESKRLIRDALELVDEKQKRPIELTYYEGLTASEVAERTANL